MACKPSNLMKPRVIEASWPHVVPLLAPAAWYWGLGAPFPFPSPPLLSAALTAAAVVIGFLATAKAVMLGLSGTPAFLSLKEAGFTKPLFRYLFESVWL